MPFHPGINQTSKETAALTLGEQRGAHGDKDDEQRVCKHGAHLARLSPRSHPPRGESTPEPERPEETWRDRPSRSATTLTAPSLHFRFRGADPELQASLPPSGRHSRERAATRKSRGPKARARPGLARVGKPGRSEDGAVVEAALRPRQCVTCSPSPIAYLTLEPCHTVAGLHPHPRLRGRKVRPPRAERQRLGARPGRGLGEPSRGVLGRWLNQPL